MPMHKWDGGWDGRSDWKSQKNQLELQEIQDHTIVESIQIQK